MKRSTALILGLFSTLLSREALATEMSFACNYELGRESDANRRKIGSVVLAIDIDAKTAKIDFGKGWFKTVAFQVDGTDIKETGLPASGPELGFFYFDLKGSSGGFTGGGDLREFFDACVQTNDTAHAAEDAHARSAAVNAEPHKGLPTLTPSPPIVPSQLQPEEQASNKGRAAEYPRDQDAPNKLAAISENAPTKSAGEKAVPGPAVASAVPAAPTLRPLEGRGTIEGLNSKRTQAVPAPVPQAAQSSGGAKANKDAPGSVPGSVVAEALPAEPSHNGPGSVADNALREMPSSVAQSSGFGKEPRSAQDAAPIAGTAPGLQPGEEHGTTEYFGSRDPQKSSAPVPETAAGSNSEKTASVSEKQPVGEAVSAAPSPVTSTGIDGAVEPCRAALSAETASAKVTFANSSFWIALESRRELEKIAQLIKECGNVEVEVAGHTDNWGSPIDNKRLSQLRAEAVVRFLIGVGIDPSKLKAVGFGQEQPIATNGTAEGRRTNRRVELRVSTTTSSN